VDSEYIESSGVKEDVELADSFFVNGAHEMRVNRMDDNVDDKNRLTFISTPFYL